jgi:hypothetical protein
MAKPKMKKKMWAPEPMMEQDHECMNNDYADKVCMDMVLAHSYVPWQQYEQAFCPPEALMKGTLFPELFGVYPIPM